MKKLEIGILIFITLLILILKFLFFDYQSGDYNIFLSRWIDIMKNNGGLQSLKHTFTDYNYPYLIMLAIISYIPIKSVYLIKAVSLIFDMLLIILGCKFVYKYTKDEKKKKLNTKIAYIVLSVSPIIFMNSCVWGQCDSIYAFFTLLSIYYLCSNKVFKSFIFLGIAFSFKLQTIFILPMYGIMLFCRKRVKIYHFFIIPLVNFIMCIPAYLVGGSPLYTYKTYFFQTKEYGLGFYTTNIYSFLSNDKSLIMLGVILTALIFLTLLIYCYIKKDNINEYSILNLSVLSVGICYFFLPCMHERYSYLFDVFSIIWVIIYGKKYFIPILINICSFTLYSSYLMSFTVTKNALHILTIFYFISLLFIMFITIYNIEKKEVYKLCNSQ